MILWSAFLCAVLWSHQI